VVVTGPLGNEPVARPNGMEAACCGARIIFQSRPCMTWGILRAWVTVENSRQMDAQIDAFHHLSQCASLCQWTMLMVGMKRGKDKISGVGSQTSQPCEKGKK
jgi:hypothetical protein